MIGSFMTTPSKFPSLLIIKLQSRYRQFWGKFINFHNKSYSIYFCHHTILLKFLLQSCFYRSHRVRRAGGLAEAGVVLSIFIDFHFSFFSYGNTFFQLISIELFSFCSTYTFVFLSASAVCVCYCVSFYFPKKNNAKRIFRTTGWHVSTLCGNHYRHLSVGDFHFHVCLCDNLHIWWHRMIRRSLDTLRWLINY